jgi:hypothetical protein
VLENHTKTNWLKKCIWLILYLKKSNILDVPNVDQVQNLAQKEENSHLN